MGTNSPFNITFGERPKNYINRESEFNSIVEVFDSEIPETKIKIITGPRGCGKTVLLSQVKKYYDDKDSWITADVNPNGDILEQLASKIYESGKVKKLFLKAEFNFSFKGIGLTIHGDEPVSSIYTLLDKMFKYLKKKEIRVLITIDDCSTNENMKIFAHSYQSFIREEYPAFLLITGLYENVDKLEKVDNLTFLARAPKLFLNKLSIRAVTMSYMRIFDISEEEAIKIAKQTNGYAYGYQLLGSLLYKSNSTKLDKTVLDKYDLSLEDNAYSMIWEALPETERQVLIAIASTNGVIKDIVSNYGITNSKIQMYKPKLKNKGIIDCSTRGKITFELPRFKEFVLFQKKLMEEWLKWNWIKQS